MKRTLKGIVLAGEVLRIRMFDGDFTTGYRLKRLIVTPKDIGTAEAVWVRLLTRELSHSTQWNWSKNDQVGWASWGVPTNTRPEQFGLVDEEAIIIEDLYLDASGDTGENVNYLLEIEKISFSDWTGALALVQNRSQDV